MGKQIAAHMVIAQTVPNQIAWVVSVYVNRSAACTCMEHEQATYAGHDPRNAEDTTPSFKVIPVNIHMEDDQRIQKHMACNACGMAISDDTHDGTGGFCNDCDPIQL